MEEVMYVINATTVAPDYQRLRLQSGTGGKPKGRFVNFGRLFSACNSDSNSVVVQKSPQTANFTEAYFSGTV
jgi:hypothetical protein